MADGKLTMRIQARISQEGYEKLEAEAKARGIKISDLLRWIIGERYRSKAWRDESKPIRDA